MVEVINKSIGRRKSAIAQVELRNGSGKLIINGTEGSKYMQHNPKVVYAIQYPLKILGLEESFDIIVKCKGGGLTGQSEAIKLGIARSLCKLNTTHRSLLKSHGLLTRNARVKERKKYGLKKARKAPQFSKR